MFIFIFTDGNCFLYVYHAKVSLLEQTKHIISLHTIQNVVSLSISFHFFGLLCFLSKLINKSSYLHLMLGMLCFISRVYYLTFVKAVTLILKHATLLRSSNQPQPEEALTIVDLNYQKANIDESIQQYLMACASELSVEHFVSFVMGTNISLLFSFSLSLQYFIVFLVSSQSSANTGV